MKLSRAGYSHSTIKPIHALIFPALEMAVDDDIIRKILLKMHYHLTMEQK